jgi:hypothetical protein
MTDHISEHVHGTTGVPVWHFGHVARELFRRKPIKRAPDTLDLLLELLAGTSARAFE